MDVRTGPVLYFQTCKFAGGGGCYRYAYGAWSGHGSGHGYRKAGDYIIVDDEGHHKKLKQVFTGDKIPAQQRAGLWLIAHESLVHAIIGYRSGCSALVTPQTGKVLKITFYGGKQNGFFKKI